MKFDDTSASDESNALESCGAVTNLQLHRESKKQDTKLFP